MKVSRDRSPIRRAVAVLRGDTPRDVAAAPAGVGELALEVARLERTLARTKEQLRAAGGDASPIDEAWVSLDYERAEVRIAASAYRRWNSVAKEPFTVAWLERSLRAGDVLYDIGANIGAYSLIAAVTVPEARVYAFEPVFDNYAAICRNAILNGLDERLVALPVALAATSGLASLRLRTLGPGGAQHHVGNEPPFTPVSTQTTLAVRLDDLIDLLGLPVPTHVKLDVDGAEADVLAGAERLLDDETLREIQVEVEPGDDRSERLLVLRGFGIVERHETRAVTNLLFRRNP